MKAFGLLQLIIAMLFLSLGCKSKPTLVGDWTGTMSAQGVSVELDFNFGADGTISVMQSANGKGSTQRGTYKSDDKSFTMIPTSVESAAIPKESLDQLNAAIAKNPKPVVFTLVWTNDDTITVNQQGAQPPGDVAIILKRKKS